MSDAPTAEARLDEAVAFIRGCLTRSDIAENGRRLLDAAILGHIEEAEAKAKSAGKMREQDSDYVDFLLSILGVAKSTAELRDKFIGALSIAAGTYAAAMKDEGRTVSSAKVRHHIKAVLKTAIDLRDQMNGLRDDQTGKVSPMDQAIAAHSRMLMQEAALEVVMQRLFPSRTRTRPFGKDRNDHRPLWRGERARRGASAATGYVPEETPFADAVETAGELALPSEMADKAQELAGAIDAALFHGDAVEMLIQTAEAALERLPQGSATYAIGPQASYTAVWCAIELITAFGQDVQPSQTVGGPLEDLVKEVFSIGNERAPKTSTVYAHPIQDGAAAWANGRAATMFCDEQRRRTEDARAAIARTKVVDHIQKVRALEAARQLAAVRPKDKPGETWDFIEPQMNARRTQQCPPRKPKSDE